MAIKSYILWDACFTVNGELHELWVCATGISEVESKIREDFYGKVEILRVHYCGDTILVE